MTAIMDTVVKEKNGHPKNKKKNTGGQQYKKLKYNGRNINKRRVWGC